MKRSSESLYLQSSKDQKKSKINFYDHLQMILTKHPDHLTQYQENNCGHEHGQYGAKERSPKKHFNNYTGFVFHDKIRADINTLNKVLGKVCWTRVFHKGWIHGDRVF